MLQVRKRKDSPYWQIQGYIKVPNGSHRVRQSSGTTDRQEAENYALKIHREVIDKAYGKGHSTDYSFGSATIDYLNSKESSICQNKEEYDFLINISGIHALLTLTMECSFPYLIELSQELDLDITTELKTNYNPSENTVCNKSEMGKILYFPKSFPEK